MKKLKFKESNGNYPNTKERILAYIEKCYGLLHKINKKLGKI